MMTQGLRYEVRFRHHADLQDLSSIWQSPQQTLPARALRDKHARGPQQNEGQVATRTGMLHRRSTPERTKVGPDPPRLVQSRFGRAFSAGKSVENRETLATAFEAVAASTPA